jgi:glycosyltransferase involved in cell wall biosynthesis
MPPRPLSLSIVTPSYNQGRFLEETIQSVLGQGYPNLQYVIMDGGSKDDSAEIIRRYADKLTYWCSEKDQGHYDAINKGFSRTNGEIMAWINSDDKYAPWAFSVVADIFSKFPQIEWLTTAYPMHWDKLGKPISCFFSEGYNRKAFLGGANLPGRSWHVGPWVQQETTFWRRSLWERAGGALDNSSVAGDFELWTRFFKFAELHTVATPLGGFRMHGDQISVNKKREYFESSERFLAMHGGRPFSLPRRILRSALHLAFGGRSLHRLPLPLGRVLTAMGMAFSAPQCRWVEDEWKVVDTYVF